MAESVTPSPVRALVGLRGKLTLRQFTRERGRILGAVFALLIFGPLIAGATFGTAVGYRQLPDQWPTGLLGGVFVLLWLIWFSFPIFISSINEGLDVTRLLIYPLPRRSLVVGTLLGTIFDYPTYLMLPLFGAVIFGFGFGPAVLIGIIVCYAHMIIIGQLVTTAVGGIIQSRRFRDVSIILASLFGSSCYFIQQGLAQFAERAGGFVDEETLVTLQPLNALQWFPTGAIARFIEQAQGGNWQMAVVWLAYSLILLALFTFIWSQLLYRLATGGGYLIQLKPREEKAKPAKARAATANQQKLSWLSGDIAELALKEARSVWRVPQRRVGLVQGLIFPLFIAGGAIFGGDMTSVDNVPRAVSLGIPFYALFAYWATTQNMLAWEGRGIATLLLTPVPRHRIFYAKGLVLFWVAGAPYIIIGAIYTLIARDWLAIVGLLTGLGMGLASMSATAVTSVLFPMRINLESKQTRSSFQTSGAGCRNTAGSVILTPLLVLIVAVPGGIMLGLAWWFDLAWLGFLGVIISFVYGGVMYWGGSRLAGRLLTESEAAVLTTLKHPEED